MYSSGKNAAIAFTFYKLFSFNRGPHILSKTLEYKRASKEEVQKLCFNFEHMSGFFGFHLNSVAVSSFSHNVCAAVHSTSVTTCDSISDAIKAINPS